MIVGTLPSGMLYLLAVMTEYRLNIPQVLACVSVGSKYAVRLSLRESTERSCLSCMD